MRPDGTHRADKVPLSQQEVQTIIQRIMNEQMTYSALRPIAFSFCDMEVTQFQRILDSMQGDIDDSNEIAALERDQTFLMLVGLKDPVRPTIKTVVKEAREATINLRLVSGDNLHTTARVAYDTDIMTQQEYEVYTQNPNNQTIAMDASVFRERVGEVIRTEEENDQEGKNAAPVFKYSLSQ